MKWTLPIVTLVALLNLGCPYPVCGSDPFAQLLARDYVKPRFAQEESQLVLFAQQLAAGEDILWFAPTRWQIYVWAPPMEAFQHVEWIVEGRGRLPFYSPIGNYEVVGWPEQRQWWLIQEIFLGGSNTFVLYTVPWRRENTSSVTPIRPPGQSKAIDRLRTGRPFFDLIQPSAVLSDGNVVYLAGSSANPVQVWITTSKDQGCSWEELCPLATGTMPKLVAVDNKLRFLFYKKANEQEQFGKSTFPKGLVPWSLGPLYALTVTDAREFSEERLIVDLPIYAFDAKAFGDDLYLLVAVEQGDTISLQLIRSTDGGLTWSEPLTLTEGPFRDVDPTIAVYEDKLLVAFTRYQGDELLGVHYLVRKLTDLYP